ncbi:biotin--[acetyl-CoA-carboxylase] ligase [bacterium]|nr:biotin--[acetyl-CoA-carboxylase] ligase [bacterium]
MIHLKQCDSTQDLAWECEPGTFVVADTQTRGRGRGPERIWVSPPGGLYLSWRLGAVDPVGFSLLGGLAVLRCLSHWGVHVYLKWPNDCWVERDKIAGVLPDARWRGSQCSGLVLGIGVNVQVEPALLPEHSVSLHQLVAQAPSVEEFGQKLRAELEALLAVHVRSGLAGYLEEVRSHSLPPGTGVAYWLNGERFQGEVLGLDEQGFLLLADGSRLTAVERLILL